MRCKRGMIETTAALASDLWATVVDHWRRLNDYF
jgi:hypothetical protein